MLNRLQRRGQRAFDGDGARKAFAELGEYVTIYRGTVECEDTKYGVCWTLDRDTAAWFASEHGRFRNTSSPPVILTATVRKDQICGLMIERQEHEVLVLPRDLEKVLREPVDQV